MSDMKSEDKIYELLGELSPDSPTKGISGIDSDNNQSLTDLYITTMYFSALSNLYLQNFLSENTNDLMPRFMIAFQRSYADFTSAKDWLSTNTEYIESSSAKAYYDEVQGMGIDKIKTI